MRMILEMNVPTLARLADGRSGVVASLELSPEERAELDAVGVAPGREVTVLRRAPFAGPLHVRLDTGVELCLDVALASRVVLAGGVA